MEGHNHIGRNTYAPGTELGYGTNISHDGYFYNTKIGKYTCIGPRSAVIGGKHPIDTIVSIHPAFYSKVKQAGLSYIDEQIFEEFTYVDGTGVSVVIGNDVWIGADAKIMQGVTIGDGAVVAAGALVLKDVEPYEIVAGIPAKTIKYRFDEEDRRWLMELQWWNKPVEWIRYHAKYFRDIKILRKMLS
ncbi:MAG: CatB-related O-acetyltransferase [Lachnospiraceae bacterium]|nr:CatB-related O-acetyltransferase [Lachnospiraceae bacterium]